MAGLRSGRSSQLGDARSSVAFWLAGLLALGLGTGLGSGSESGRSEIRAGFEFPGRQAADECGQPGARSPVVRGNQYLSARHRPVWR